MLILLTNVDNEDASGFCMSYPPGLHSGDSGEAVSLKEQRGDIGKGLGRVKPDSETANADTRHTAKKKASSESPLS